MTKKNAWYIMPLAVIGPFVLFYILLLVSVEIAKRTPEDELPQSTIREAAMASYQAYVTVIAEKTQRGEPVPGVTVILVRDEGSERQELRTTTDSAGTATFTLSKKGRLEVRIEEWGETRPQVVASLEAHPDEMVHLRFQPTEPGL